MERVHALLLRLWVAASSSAAFPVAALAQGGPSAPGKGSQPTSGAAPADTTAGSGSGWLWIVAALVVLAIVWWAVRSRRRAASRSR